MKRFTSEVMLALILINTLTLTFSIRPVNGEWTGTVYIRADGSIYPLTACISRYGSLYVLEDDITGGIIVERNNLVIDGRNHTIRGSPTEIVSGIILENVENVTVLNFQIENAGIELRQSSNCSILSNFIKGGGLGLVASNCSVVFNNTFVGNWYKYSSGVSIAGSGNKVIQNTIVNYYFGVVLTSVYAISYTGHAVNSVIAQNEITSCGFGIWCLDPDNCFVQNKITKCKYGIYVEAEYQYKVVAKNITVDSNDLLSNTYGIFLMDLNYSLLRKNNLINNDWGVWISHSSNVAVAENNFQRNNVAIVLCASSNCNVTENTINNTDIGVFLSSSSRLEIHGNMLAGNFWGIVSSNCSDVLVVGNDFVNSAVRLENGKFHQIFHNNFINITISISASEVLLDRGYPTGGNYWNEYVYLYSYSDYNGDGIGDTEYRFHRDRVYIDKYPFVNPRKCIRMKILVNVYPKVVTKGTNVTIEGSVEVFPANVSILYRRNNGTWNILRTVETDQEGHYSLTWNVTQEGLYEIKVVWLGNLTVFPVESEVKVFNVESTAEIPSDFQLYLETGMIILTIIIVVSLLALIFRYRKTTNRKAKLHKLLKLQPVSTHSF